MPLYYHTGALGDFLLALPFLRALRALGLEGPWTLVAAEEPAKVVGRIFPAARRLPPGLLEWAPLSRGEPDPQELEEFLRRYGAVFGFAREAEKIEEAARRAAPGARVVLSEPFSRTTALGEEIEETLARAIAKLGGLRPRLDAADFSISREELPPPPPGFEFPSALDSGGKFACVHVGASAREKVLPCALLKDLSCGLKALGLAVLWIRGPVEAERGIEAPPGPLLDCPDIVALAHAVSRAALYIGADTGPTHLAAQLGAPTVSVHARANPLWRPRGARSRVVAGGGGFPEAREVLAAALCLMA